jgi:Fe-S-cluster containining protein
VSNSEPKPCALCHASGHGCCRLASHGPENIFGLCTGEINTICKTTGSVPDAFMVEDKPDPSLIDAAEALHPALARTMNGGHRLRLRITDDGTCCFLGASGCKLPRRVRPLFCRMYPVFVRPQGELALLFNPHCQAQEGAGSPEEVLERLGQSEKSLRNLHNRWLRLSAAHGA